MHFDLHLNASFNAQIKEVAGRMQSWQAQGKVDSDEAKRIRQAIQSFSHTTKIADLKIAAVDGSGDFPMLSYADSFVYLAVAQATVYKNDALSGLKEEAPVPKAVFECAWLPEDSEQGQIALDHALEQLSGLSLMEVIERSDYRMLKNATSRRQYTCSSLLENLLRPRASDTGNIGVQMRSTAELGAALRVLTSPMAKGLQYLLMDSTLSLPMVTSGASSLFFEHLKRLCCVEAASRDIGFFALSKSHGLNAIESIETLACEVQGLGETSVAEHWYLRIPDSATDGWELSLTQGRSLPPVGAVSYLVRFHRSTPVLRLDVDRVYWENNIGNAQKENTCSNERKLFDTLDYACHDQRSYGYPYPIKAAHDRASFSQAERIAWRKALVAEAMKLGMNPVQFRDASIATGHR